ncbi:hypothetical protein [Agrococcus casei]|uniref:hypothetical protein n=1 Tax=Agrococcus casei TaxID=343512 RepID=UPI003F9225E2
MGIALTEFLDTTRTPASGRYDIDYGGLSIPCSWESRGHHTTLVTFSGALTPNVTELPAFVGWGTTRHLTCNVLMLSDPSLAIDPKLRLGWYAGCTALPRLQAKLTRVIRRFAGRSRVVLFGASGGGFAALEHAPRLPGSLAIVSNPQTDILRYDPPAVKNYLSIAWNSTPESAPQLPFEHEVITRYRSRVPADVIYLQNSSDDFHIENHERPFRECLHPSNRVHFIRGSFGKGHVGPDKQQFARMFEAATSERRFSRVVAGVDAALR